MVEANFVYFTISLPHPLVSFLQKHPTFLPRARIINRAIHFIINAKSIKTRLISHPGQYLTKDITISRQHCSIIEAITDKETSQNL
ncbi:hypothetical protein MIMGU_mgv1a017277mg [Erythranthe guttata]|uniref:Uncharacterized protein n=1 Tax=Erythranthe guttata TaxID=4155 RepID=A0A022Q2A6_ERYGU|nr:hypothetical protein MIMGU_mgv1a017277mg [Erythranthe guttata]